EEIGRFRGQSVDLGADVGRAGDRASGRAGRLSGFEARVRAVFEEAFRHFGPAVEIDVAGEDGTGRRDVFRAVGRQLRQELGWAEDADLPAPFVGGIDLVGRFIDRDSREAGVAGAGRVPELADQASVFVVFADVGAFQREQVIVGFVDHHLVAAALDPRFGLGVVRRGRVFVDAFFTRGHEQV